MYVGRVSGAVHKALSIHMYVGVDDNIAIQPVKLVHKDTQAYLNTSPHQGLL